MAFNINEIKSQLVLGGARSSHFQVYITNPVTAAANLKTPFMVKAAQMPPSTMSPIDVFYFGRPIKVAGDRMFPEWTVTVINDEDFLVRNAMEQWMNAINAHRRNIVTLGNANPESYKSRAQITAFSKTGVPIREYTFEGLFPIEVSPIETSWEAANQIQEFSVTFAYDMWEVTGGLTGKPGQP